MIGETLNGRYRFVRQLGSGGMGAVYEALDLEGGATVAVKVISAGDLSRDKKLIARFHREMKATGSIETDHIVRFFDTGTDAASGQPFMVMERLTGEDLAQLEERLGALRPELAVRIIAQACLGLQKAHDAGVVHRDIKPANLFLAAQPGGEILVKLLDFGVAKIKMDQAQVNDPGGLTRTGSMIGSPLYMAPEQARGSKTIDHRADVWSLGIVLYQALAGRTPHHDIEALGELIIAICSELPAPVQDFAPWVPAEIATITQKALRFDPAERYQTAEEMLLALRALSPSGLDLRPEMLTPLSAAERAHVATRAQDSLPSTAPNATVKLSAIAANTPAQGGDTLALEPTLQLTNDEPQAPVHVVSTPPPAPMAAPIAPVVRRLPDTGPITSRASLPTIPPAQPNRAPLVVGLAVAIGLGAGIAAYKLTAPPEPVPAPSAAPAQSTAPPARSVTPPPPASTPTPAPPPAKRRVRVTITPPDAKVEIGSAKVDSTGGAFEIEGVPGSVHHVHLSKGKREIEIDVTVTEEGAKPAKIALP